MDIDYSLYLVADADFASVRDLPALVTEAVGGGVTVVQLRAKSHTGSELIKLGHGIAAILERSGIPLLINDHPDIALACGAAGVHLGQGDLPAAEARHILGPERVIGVSVNTAEEARRAEHESANYVGAGPAYATATKETDLPVLGQEGIARIKRAVGIPVVAIGGIGQKNASAMARAGVDGIAVVSAILGAPDARRAAEELRKAFRR